MDSACNVVLLLICISCLALANLDARIADEILNLYLAVKSVVVLREHKDAGPKTGGNYTQKYGAVCKLDDDYYVFGAFATLDGYDSTGTKLETAHQQFLCLGFGQRTKSLDLAQSAMEAYLTHPDAFGIVVSLPTLFSGNESIANDYFSKECIQEKIRTLIKYHRDEKSQYDAFTVSVVRAWVLPVGGPSANNNRPSDVGYVGILKVSVGLIDTFRFCKCQNPSNNDMKNLKLEIGTPQADETKAILTFVDYVQKTNLTDMTTKPTQPIDLNNQVHALSYTMDFVFRKLSGVERGDLDHTPAGNMALSSARFLLNMGPIEFSTLIALLLNYVIRLSDTTLTEIKEYFGNEVASLLNCQRTNLPKITVYKLSTQEEDFFKSFEDTNTQTGLQENEALVKLLERRYKAYSKEKTISKEPISVSFVKGFKIDATAFAVFLASRADLTTKYNFVMRGQLHSNPKMVVEELLKSDPDTIQQFVTEDYTEARIFYLQTWKLTSSNLVTEVACQVLTTGDLAGRKHGGEVQKRKGGFKSAYLNHVLGVLIVLLLEGKITVQDLNNIMDKLKKKELETRVTKIAKALNAALMHDTLENTSASKMELKIVLGEEVANWVDEVSDPKDLTTSEAKKKNQEEKALTQSAVACLIKIADRINNLRDWLLLLPDALAWPKRPFYVDSTKILVRNYKSNYAKNSANWQPWETIVFNNLIAILDDLLKYYDISCTTTSFFYL